MQENAGKKESKNRVDYGFFDESRIGEGYYEDEIDLLELIFVLWKQRWFCILVITSVILIAFIYILMAPRLYKITCQVRPGITGYDEKGNPVRGLAPQDVKLYFEKKENWLQALTTPQQFKPLNIVTKNRRGTSIVDISILWPDPKAGVTILEKVLSYVAKDSFGKLDREIQFFRKSVGQALNKAVQNKEHIKIERKRLDDSLRKLNGKLAILSAGLDSIRKNRVLLTETLESLEKQLLLVNKNTLELLKARQKVEKSRAKDGLAFLVYLNVVQQNIAYLNSLETRTANLKKDLNQYNVDIMKKRTEMDNLKITIEDLKLKRDKELPMKEKALEKKIETLKAKLAAIQPLEILAPPTSSIEPVKPKKKLILALALVFGFFVAIFLAFVKNFWEKRKPRYMERENADTNKNQC